MTLRVSLLAATACVALATTAAHAQQLTSGGSTLASPTYLSEFAVFENNNPNTNFSNQYTPEGSGAAQTAVVTDTPAGFDFGASDALASAANITAYNNNRRATEGNLVVLPTFGVPITVALNFAGVASNTAVNLTDAQLCGVFSGKVTNTSDPVLSGSGLPSGQPITVVYRSDGSGTSFLFTQHLAAVCNAGNSAITFTAVTAFNTLFPNGTPPANFIGGAGSAGSTANPGVQPQINSHASSLGYLSPDYTRITTQPNGSPPYVAEVNGVQPTAANTSLALSSAPTPTITASNPNSAIPVVANPTNGYPIVGYTTWLMPQCFADPTVATAIKSFITATYRQTIYRALISNGGFSVPPSSLETAVSNAYLGSNAATSINGVGAAGCNGSGIVGR